MSEKPRVDPRYPAAFQRGHDGAADMHPVTSPPRVPDAAMGGPPARDTAGANQVPAAENQDTVGSGVVPSPSVPAEPEERNPFVTVAWVLSLALILGGAWLVFWAQSNPNYGWTGNQPPFEMVLRQIAYALSGPAITAGLIGIIGLLFWHAAAWRRRAIAEHTSP